MSSFCTEVSLLSLLSRCRTFCIFFFYQKIWCAIVYPCSLKQQYMLNILWILKISSSNVKVFEPHLRHFSVFNAFLSINFPKSANIFFSGVFGSVLTYLGTWGISGGWNWLSFCNFYVVHAPFCPAPKSLKSTSKNIINEAINDIWLFNLITIIY